MKLHHHPISTTSRAVLLFAADRRIPLELQALLARGQPGVRHADRRAAPHAPLRRVLTQASTMIHGLHHNAYRCRDSEQTRRFYEDFLGLPLAGALTIRRTRTGRATEVLHTFFRLGDGSFLAFFEAPDQPFEFKPQHDFDLHIALAVDEPALGAMLLLAQQAGIEARGISDHGFIRSIYLRDPNGYVIELAAPAEGGAAALDSSAARAELQRWQAARQAALSA